MDPLFRLDHVDLRNFRPFDDVRVPLHPQITVVYAENGGGKTALLNGVAVALDAAFVPAKRQLDESRDVREVIDTPSGTLVPHFPTTVEVLARVSGQALTWKRSLIRPGANMTSEGTKGLRSALDALYQDPGAAWPVFAFYGTQRLWDAARKTSGKKPEPGRRADGYVDALDPRSKEEQLVEWVRGISLARLQQGEGPTDRAFLRALRAAGGHPVGARGADVCVDDIVFDLRRKEVVIALSGGERVPWSRLSDGYHVFLALVTDIARRCVTLNPHLGEDAVRCSQGVVLIDEIDLHLHPRWQRVVARRLVEAFPGLQFVVSTHSPQVLSSVRNDQVVGLVGEKVLHPVPVAGRDSNALLREVFGTSERDSGQPEAAALERLQAALETEDWEVAKAELRYLREVWGDLDPEVVRAEHLIAAESA